MISWVIFALIAAFTLATADSISKKALRNTDEYVIAWVRQGYSLPFLALAFFFIEIPTLDRTFWLTLLLMLPLEITAIILYVKAIKISPLSVTIPFLTLSPVFIILTAFFILGELPDKSGFIGIFLIAFGGYLLNIRATANGILGPVKAIGKERGSIFMIGVALIYSITSTLGKVSIQHSSPIFFGFFYPFVLTIILTIILGSKGILNQVVSTPKIFIGIGLFISIMVMSHFIALSMTDVAYMISVKRFNLIFSVIYGRFLFMEKHTGERLIGSLMMITGVISITLF